MEKKLERGCFFKEKKGREGVLGKSALFFFLRTVDRIGEGGQRRPGLRRPRAWQRLGHGKKTERRARGFDSPPHLGLGRSEEVDPRRPAEELRVAALQASTNLHTDRPSTTVWCIATPSASPPRSRVTCAAIVSAGS